ncbi:MAG: DUF3306 domain-containing protein [Hyphomicrobiaceae bacterium]
MAEDAKSFMERWSRRKAASRDGLPVEETAPEQAEAAVTADHDPARQPTEGRSEDDATPGGASPMTEEEIAAIDFDALDYGSDYTRFMQPGVPEWVRQKALRRLWVSNPLLANLDGLDDYIEDFSDAVWATPDIQTSYRVGRGFMSDEEVAEWENLGQPVEEAEVAAEDGAAPDAQATAAADASGDDSTPASEVTQTTDEVVRGREPGETAGKAPAVEVAEAAPGASIDRSRETGG